MSNAPRQKMVEMAVERIRAGAQDIATTLDKERLKNDTDRMISTDLAREEGIQIGLERAAKIVEGVANDVALPEPGPRDTSKMAKVLFDTEEDKTNGEEIAAFKKGFFRVHVVRDSDAENPRTSMDNLGTMIAFHKRYNLGDKDHGYDSNNYSGWAEMREAIAQEFKDGVILPVYMIDHGNVALQTKSFNDGWDSGQVGFIAVSAERIVACHMLKDQTEITDDIRDRVVSALEGEVETYSQYMNGEVYGFEVMDHTGIVVDSCWGCYGKDYASDEAKTALERWVEHADEKSPKLFLDIDPPQGLKALVLTVGKEEWVVTVDYQKDMPNTYFSLTLGDSVRWDDGQREDGFLDISSAVERGKEWLVELVEEQFGKER
jgi:hypothetical protein